MSDPATEPDIGIIEDEWNKPMNNYPPGVTTVTKALDREMKKLAALGVTVSMSPAQGRELTEADPMFHLRESAHRHGILAGSDWHPFRPDCTPERHTHDDSATTPDLPTGETP